MTYTVEYKLRGEWLWKKVQRVKGDLVAQDLGVPMRVFILDDETRIEIPVDGTQFRFCPRRFLTIKQNMEKEAGQVLPVRTTA